MEPSPALGIADGAQRRGYSHAGDTPATTALRSPRRPPVKQTFMHRKRLTMRRWNLSYSEFEQLKR